MGIDASELRKVLGQFATGVTVVTTVHEGAAQAMTVNSFSSVSLEPPLVLFCADNRARTNAAVAAAGAFAVSILREEQRAISDLFAGKGTDIERQAALQAGWKAATGCPILQGALGYLDCRVAQAHDAGDHVIYIGEVLTAGAGDPGAPLLYFRGTYQALESAWRWRDRYAAREKATQFHDMVDFFERMQNEGPYAGLLEKLVALSEPPRDGRCLDLGCGAGRATRELAGRCREAIGVDASTAMVARATDSAKALGAENVRYLEAQATALPFEEGAFDLVVASNLLFHLADPGAALREAARVLRPGGRLAVLEPSSTMSRAAMSAFLEEEEHDLAQFGAYALLAWADAAEATRRFNEQQLAAELTAAGFETLLEERELAGLAILAIARRV
jgi:flavin reductase (DIM6/NTAB) family NADH-FMN oxidoreductase RutF/precorrin-6B methylase 2